MDFDKKVFGERLRVLRQANSYTLVEVASALKTDKGTVSNMENGKKGVSVEKLCTLADYFDVSIDYLVGRTDKPEVNR